MTTKHFYPAKKIGTFYPPQRVLMGPGPSDTHPRVLSAMARPTLGHLDPVFTDMMEELKSLLRYAFQTSNLLTFPVSGPGSVGMEMCFVNMVNPGDKVIVCRNGVFGGRMIENVQRCGGTAVVVEDKWGAPVDPQKVEDALKQNPDAKIVAFVHAETSTGALSDAKTLVRNRAPPQLPDHRGYRHLAGWLSPQGRRMEDRRDLLRQPEVPVVPARFVAHQLFGARGGTGQESQGKSAKLVHGFESAAGLLGNHPHLSPYCSNQRTLCIA